MQVQTEKAIFDVIIIGGSYAGLSAAMALGRSLREVLIIDSGKPCNWQTPHSHNFLTRDGETPANIAGIAKAQVLAYPTVTFLNGTVNSASKTMDGFSVTCSDGQLFSGKKLILATGIKDIFPNIKGFAACWGISVLHCPYCHGYEVAHKPTGIIANGEIGFEFAKLISNWTKDLTLFTNGPITLDPKDIEKLTRKNIQISEKEIEEIIHENGKVSRLQFKDGSSHKLAAIYARGSMEHNTEVIEALAITLNDQGYINIDNFKKTNVAGVFAAGDCTNMMRAISESVYAGNLAGVFANKELIEEDFGK
ncbi:Thioredoxin reductase [Pedobacter insulae]|uniref:Thioredoxin reductase n=2 Tax=Pedobacter insulae TaxID=414048 RepID=A0A1I2X7W1_9SPHI|nr:Thioredoxin reductase [Pedobacter insulae]